MSKRTTGTPENPDGQQILFRLDAQPKRNRPVLHEFLLKEGVTETDSPNEYPIYATGYYAVFFDDPTGIHREFACTPSIPMPWEILKILKVAKELRKQLTEWKQYPAKEMMRTLPARDDLS